MKKLLLIVALFANRANAQTAYTISTSTVAYTELTGDISINNGATWDSNSSLPCPIGFTFNFYGLNITNLNVGGFGFGYNGYTFDVCGSFQLADKGLADGTLISKSPISYLLTGTAGSRILKIQFKNASFTSAPNDYVNYQVWLYETSNKIEVVTGDNSIANPSVVYDNGAPGPHIGIAIFNSDFTALNYSFILTGNPSSPTKGAWPNLNTFPPNLSGTPANGQVYTFTPSSSSGINETVAEGNSNVYPNPFSSSATVTIDSKLEIKKSKFIMYNLVGEVAFQSAIQNPQFEIQRNNLPAGIYFYTITNGNLPISKGKLIIE